MTARDELLEKHPLLRFPNVRYGGPSAPAPEPADPAAPEPPARLNAAAKTEWLRLAPLIKPWDPRFSDPLELYVTEWSQYRADPSAFNSARVSQLRLLQGALRLTPERVHG